MRNIGLASMLLFAMIIFSCNAQIDQSTTPPMGWNSWNWFGKHEINENLIYEVIDAIAENGLQEAGYEYVVVDGGWRDTKLGPNGKLLVHPKKFPNGMKPLADYAHSKGLKFGLHTVPGTHDCKGDLVGGYGNEDVQIQQFLDWGVDLIKLDKCRFKGGWEDEVLKETYHKWHRILKEKSDKDIVLSICAYKFYDWGPQVSRMARTTEDITSPVGGMSGCKAVFDGKIPAKKNPWGQQTVMQIAEENNKWADHVGNGFWNDPDMLVTGEQGLTNTEQKSHFALWCIMSAPLMLGNDPINMTQDEKDIILNKDCILIDQDTTEQGRRIMKKGNTEIWAKKMKGGKVAVLLLNRSKSKEKMITLNPNDLDISGQVKIKDVYAKKEMGSSEGPISQKVAAGSSSFLLLSK